MKIIVSIISCIYGFIFTILSIKNKFIVKRRNAKKKFPFSKETNKQIENLLEQGEKLKKSISMHKLFNPPDKLENDVQHAEALSAVERLWNIADTNKYSEQLFLKWVVLVEEYEDKHYKW